MKKVFFSHELLSVILIVILVMQFFPYQSLDAFVQNQLATTILGSGLSTTLSFGLTNATGVDFDPSGNLWVADSSNNRIIKYPTTFSTGMAATVVLGQPNLSSSLANNGGISANSLRLPYDIMFDGSGNLWVSDALNNRILRYSAPLTTGQSASLVLGQADFVSGSANRGGSVAANTLSFPHGLTMDSSGNLWVADTSNNRVLRYDTPFTNGEAATIVLGQADFVSGLANRGSSVAADTLSAPNDLIFDMSDDLYVADFSNNRVLKYVASFTNGEAATVALGQSSLTSSSSGTTTTTLFGPNSLEFMPDGHLFVSDLNNNRLVHYSDGDSLPATNAFATGGAGDIFVGQPDGVSGTCNQSSIFTPDDNTLCGPEGLVVDGSGDLWVTDFFNNRVLKFSAPLSTDMSATLVLGQQNFVTNSANRGGLSSTSLSNPDGITPGSFWVADAGNHRVLKFDSPFSTGQAASKVVGQPDFVSGFCNQSSSIFASPAASTLCNPEGIFLDPSGNLWIADASNSRVLKFDSPISSSADSAELVLGQPLFTTNGGTTTSTGLSFPTDVTMDSSGNLWVADAGNNRVLKFVPPFSNGMAASLVLGQADFVSGSANRGGSVAANTLSFPSGVVFDSLGNLWITDEDNNRIVKYAPLATSASVVLGQANFVSGSANRGLTAPTSATLNFPVETAFDSEGNLWVTDASNNRVLKYSDGDTNPSTSNFVNGQAASSVIGQPDFISDDENNGGISSNTLIGPLDLAFGSLGVTDHGNHRVLVFADQPSSTLVSLNSLAAGFNSFTLGSFTTTLVVSGSWDTANLNIMQTDANPVTSSPGLAITKFYQVDENSDVVSSPTINFTYTDAQLGAFDESTLKIRRFSNNAWSDLTTTINAGANTASASTPGYSIFVLVGSTIVRSDTVSISDNIGAAIRPRIASAIASDPGADDAVLNAGDTITVTFTQPTNQVFRGTTNSLTNSDVNAIFTFSPSLSATTFSGRWLDPFTLRITVASTTDTTPVGLTIAVKSTSGLTHAAAPSPAETGAVAVTGDFGTKQGPFIVSFVADDPDPQTDAAFSTGDTITVRFSEATNRAGFAATTILTKAQVDSIFTFSQSLGTDYTGQWLTASTFRITGVNPTGATAAIGTTTATVIHPNLKDAAGTSLVSTSTSPALFGSFGTFTASQTVAPQSTATVPLPSGQTLQVTTPAGAATTTITATRDTAAVPANLLGFLGNVVDITSTGNQCAIAPGCTVSYTFDESDLAAQGISSPTLVAITHDKNNDGDFDDAGETLATTVVPTSPPGPFTATATDPFTSKFAIGGIKALALGGASGEFSPPSFSSKAFAENEYPLTIQGTGFKLEKYSQTIPTVNLETGKPVQFKMLLHDGGGVSTIQHLAMYMNLRDKTRDIQYSDTYIIYDKSVPTVVSDPNGYFQSVKVTPQTVGNKLELTFDVIFAKPMEKSDIIFRMWDDRRNNADTKVYDAIQVTGPEVESGEAILDETMSVQTIEPKQTSIPSWIKDNAGWWKDGQIADSEFVSGIQYLIENDVMSIPETEESSYLSPQPIPAWIKNNAGWWRDGLISDSEFVSGIQWLVSNGIMTVS